MLLLTITKTNKKSKSSIWKTDSIKDVLADEQFKVIKINLTITEANINKIRYNCNKY